MKYVVFSDIHGNLLALNKMLDETSGRYDGYIFCGDVMGYYNHPAEVIDLMQTMPNLMAVRGNHDADYIGQKRCDLLYKKYGSSYRTKLTSCQLDYLKSLPEKIEKKINGKNICVFHGTPNDYLNGRCYPTNKDFASYHEGITFFGHTHYRMIRLVNGKCIINPGSLGQPRDGKGFSYAIYDFVTDYCDFKTVEVNISQLHRDILANESNPRVIDYLVRKNIR